MNKTCEDCIHYPLCSDIGASRYDNFDDEFGNTICTIFKDKSKFIELPCAIGDIVWLVEPSNCNGYGCPYNGDYGNWRCNVNGKRQCKPFIYDKPFTYDMIGQEFYLTRKKAEKKLEELNNEAFAQSFN